MAIEDEMRRLTDALSERTPELAESIRSQLAADVPEYYESGDPAVMEADLRSVGSALREIIEGLSHGRTPPERPSGPAVEEARLAAQAGIDLQALLRTYRVAQAVTLQAILEEAERLISPAETRLAVLTLAARYQFEWNDKVMATLVDVYQRERDLLFRDRERQKRELIRDLLAGLPVDTGRLAYNLRGDHLGVMAWGAAPEDALRSLAAHFGAELLSVGATAGAVSAWLGAPGITVESRTGPEIEPPQSTHVALGEAARGLEGFRVTHRQALQAYRVALVRPRPVTLYLDVALEALVARDLQLARDFVVHELGAIAGADHRDRVLRSVENRLGAPVASRREELAVALRLNDLLTASSDEPAATEAPVEQDDGEVGEP